MGQNESRRNRVTRSLGGTDVASAAHDAIGGELLHEHLGDLKVLSRAANQNDVGKVAKIVPRDVELTSFSILFARYKGNLRDAVRGAAMLDKLQNGDKILISEGCTHHRQCGDIGTVKLPKWISDYTGKQLEFEFTSGRDFPEDLSPYALVIHCGGCMLTEREMQYRARHASDSGIPMSNYGIIIAHTHGILRRSLEPFKDILNELN